MEISQVGVYIGKYSLQGWSWTNINGYAIGTGKKVLYRKCSGLEDHGKVKNIYTETYADSGVVRTDFPDTITREATTITLDLIITRAPSVNSGGNEVSQLLSLVGGNQPVVLWDSVRQKMAVMTLVNAVEVKEDSYKGMKYVEVELKFSNLQGYCPYVGDTFSNGHLPYVETAALPVITKALS